MLADLSSAAKPFDNRLGRVRVRVRVAGAVQ